VNNSAHFVLFPGVFEGDRTIKHGGTGQEIHMIGHKVSVTLKLEPFLWLCIF
jgi:hypothetical protein